MSVVSVTNIRYGWGWHNYFDNADYVCLYEDCCDDNDDDYEDNDDDRDDDGDDDDNYDDEYMNMARNAKWDTFHQDRVMKT